MLYICGGGGALGVFKIDTIFISTYTYQGLEHLRITLPLVKVYFPSIIYD